MASAIIAGLVTNGVAGQHILVKDPHEDKRQLLTKRYGVLTYASAGDWLSEADVVVIAVKPQKLRECAQEVRQFIPDEALLLSIAASVSVQTLRTWFNHKLVIRAMPNTPSLVGRGISGLYVPPDTADEHVRMARQILESVGKVVSVESEDGIHLITGGSGSGPAYVFLFLEAFAQALEDQGLTQHQARELALGTVDGAVQLAQSTGENFEQLRLNVTSKGGTTAKAVEALEANGIRDALSAAVKACIARSREMSELYR